MPLFIASIFIHTDPPLPFFPGTGVEQVKILGSRKLTSKKDVVLTQKQLRNLKEIKQAEIQRTG